MEKKDDTGAEIIYHFKVDQHRIPLTLSIDTAQVTKDILDDFNRQFFNGKLKYDLHALPSEEGSLIKRVLVTAHITASVTAYTLGIPASILYFNDRFFTESSANNVSDEDTQSYKLDEDTQSYKLDEDTQSYKLDEDTKKLLVNCMAGMPVYFLSHDIDKLSANNITPDKFRKSFKSRNKLYKTCMENKEIQGLSFSRTGSFPIKKESFESFLVKNLDDKYFTHNIVDIVVSSPNSKRKGRGWQTLESITFHIDDDNFWKYVDDKTITPRVQDKMQVQWIYEDNKTRPQRVRVLKVISYKGRKISEPLSKEEIQKKCDEKNAFSEDQEHAESLDSLPDLLTDLSDNNKNNSSND